MNTCRTPRIMLSLVCAGVFALSLGGCAETYYGGNYPAPEDYYPYYPWYSYYGGAYYYGE